MNREKDVSRSVSPRMFAPHVFSLVLGIMLFVPAAPIRAAEKCSSKLNDQAISRLSEARANWKALRAHHKAFAACDDGELGEGYSDAVATLLSRNWSQFGQFVALARDDAAFQRWTIKHIDASASAENLRRIVAHTSLCIDKAGEKALCTMVRTSAEAALSDADQVN
jgi:hypothetical protein